MLESQELSKRVEEGAVSLPEGSQHAFAEANRRGTSSTQHRGHSPSETAHVRNLHPANGTNAAAPAAAAATDGEHSQRVVSEEECGLEERLLESGECSTNSSSSLSLAHLSRSSHTETRPSSNAPPPSAEAARQSCDSCKEAECWCLHVRAALKARIGGVQAAAARGLRRHPSLSNDLESEDGSLCCSSSAFSAAAAWRELACVFHCLFVGRGHDPRALAASSGCSPAHVPRRGAAGGFLEEILAGKAKREAQGAPLGAECLPWGPLSVGVGVGAPALLAECRPPEGHTTPILRRSKDSKAKREIETTIVANSG
ncbi:hypothetical protein cyc_02264 [Cyclospora cayetanensis]|uniref:Uncharacterized protein n=1 Tax=Cyclospora cayetanensis TaxID=88456 RepID=A0A1D3D3I4_9EIME|nr:hypothetical protein cyc_02264 [Cyclospora cayetanensis]